MEKIKKILQKILTKEVILYIAFGVFTTIVNLGSFFVMTTLLHMNENLSNFIAIILAVLFAYVTNKDLVFHSKAESVKEKIMEFLKFMLGRAFTMVLEFVGGLILFKCFITVIVIILNFFISKFFAFKTKNKE